MSKTYRYDPSGCGRNSWNARTRTRGCKDREVLEEYMKATQAGSETNEAVRNFGKVAGELAHHVRYVVDALIFHGVVPAGDKAYHIAAMHQKIAAKTVKYSPVRVGRKSGRRADLLTFLTKVVDNEALNIRRRARLERERMPSVAITHDEERVAADDRFVFDGDRRLSDGCRCIADLEIRMDVAEIARRLPPEERMCFRLLLQEYTYGEIAERINRVFGKDVDRFYVMRVLVRRVREVVRACGYFPCRESGNAEA